MSKQHATNKGGRGARQRILNAAAELFYREGINATGVERLAAESSVSKRTLYQHFPSKTAVVEEYLRSIEDSAANNQLEGADQGPAARGGRLRGCPFHNAAVEAAGAMPGVQEIVRGSKRSFIHGLAELAK